MSISESLILGVVSGVATSALLYLFAGMFNRIVIPWYRQLIYRGITADGKWESDVVFPNGTQQYTTVDLRQTANTLSGNAQIAKYHNDKLESNEAFAITGSISDRLLHIIQRPRDHRRLGYGICLMEIIGDGSRMRGATSWYDAGSAEVHCRPLLWTRSDSHYKSHTKPKAQVAPLTSATDAQRGSAR